MKNINYYFWIFFYKITFELTYYYVISPTYSYYGLGVDVSLYKFIVSNFFFILMILLIPKSRNLPSTYLINLLFVTTIIPINSYFWLTNQSTNYAFYVFLSLITISVLLRNRKRFRIPLIKKETNYTPRILTITFVLSAILLGGFIIKFGGVDSRSFNLNMVYDLRKELSYSGVWIYITNWLGKALIPILIIASIYRKKKLMLLIGVIMQLVLYGSTGHKTFLLSIGLIITFYFYISKGSQPSIFSKLYSIVLLISIMFIKLFKNNILMSLFSVRMLSIPAWLNFIHFDFFSVNQKLHFSEGLIGKIFNLEYPYTIPSTYLVSPTGANANTGFLADAYDNGGVFAMLIFSFILSLLLIYIDSLSIKRSNVFIYTMFFIYPIIILNDSAFLTALLTSGIIIILIFYYIFASEDNYGKSEKHIDKV